MKKKACLFADDLT